MDSARNPRAAILLISDGDENGSRLKLADVVKTRRQSETAVYALKLGQFWEPRVDTSGLPIDGAGLPPVAVSPQAHTPDTSNVLRDLVDDSGGWSWPVQTSTDAELSSRALLDELRYQYLLGYSPRRTLDGKYRKLKVEVRQGGVKVRYRAGYLARNQRD
jgi:VWFA-related protein